MKIGFYTLGCKLNQTETEAVADSFRIHGRESVAVSEPADLYIINTCTVTSKSEQKARRVIRHILKENPGKPVIVTGCYAQLEEGTLSRLGEDVFAVGLEGKSRLLDLPEDLESLGADPSQSRIREAVTAWAEKGSVSEEPGSRFRFQASQYSFHSRAFMKIQDGCDNSCSYCRVRIARGRSVSLNQDAALERFKNLHAQGYTEVVLTGVNITNYRAEGRGLDFLLEKLLALNTGIRIRLSSIEPDAVTSGLLDVISDPMICPHFHLPLQSGSDTILRAMNRKYVSEQVVSLVEKLRHVKDSPFIAADLICGFPGETEEDHAATRNLIRLIQPANLHVFPYSPRPGTRALSIPSHVPERTAHERSADLRNIAQACALRYAESRVGSTADVLLEEQDPNGRWKGLSENYLPVHIDEDTKTRGGSLKRGTRYRVKLVALRENILVGLIE